MARDNSYFASRAGPSAPRLPKDQVCVAKSLKMSRGADDDARSSIMITQRDQLRVALTTRTHGEKALKARCCQKKTVSMYREKVDNRLELRHLINSSQRLPSDEQGRSC